MKLRLAKAVLVDADILLLDEPTNHLGKISYSFHIYVYFDLLLCITIFRNFSFELLIHIIFLFSIYFHIDAKTVEWLQDYLNGLTETTVITVSHDTQFVEKTSTDVIHYESRPQWGPHRKLVSYKGKMSEFVKKQPQAKHYFELSTTDLKFKFPDPGRLEGVRTSTQKFLEMENVNFAYPGNDFNTLENVNLKMSLSSRVAVLGANGAGKTTLVKMIVGDTQKLGSVN